MTVQIDTLTALANQLATVQSQLRPLQEQEAALKAEIRSNLAQLGPGDYQAGDHLVSAGATRRLDQALITQHYPATTHPQFYKLVIDPAAVRRELAPAVVDEHMVLAGDMKITVR
ncbi:hypothetical protein [Flexivirga sp.]|uniref:hypothetical protein n=1 Tax=Flexivirga sp. TaxID=1962927 RepID=UPI003F7ED02B